MDIDTLLSFNWGAMLPEFIILGAAVLLSVIDLIMPRGQSRKPLGWIAFGTILLALASLVTLLSSDVTTILYDTFRLDGFAKAFKIILLAGGALVLLLALDYEPKEGMREYRGEFYYLFLMALLGAMFMTSSADLITLFVGLELLSLSSYILAGMRKYNLASNESAMKYAINGGISTAITLFGMSYLFGIKGTTNIYDLGSILSMTEDPQIIYLTAMAFFIVLVGMSFKLATVPFHMWAPDVYQGAPTPVTAFLSVVSKTAGFAILLRLILTIFYSAQGFEGGSMLVENRHYIEILAALTMIVGNVIALRQTNIKRLFAYSSIGHAGYLLAAVSTLNAFTIESIWFYLMAYLFMTLGAFAIIQFMTEKWHNEDIYALAGLAKRAPYLAISMGIFILSLAGIPGTAGFIGKLSIFLALLNNHDGQFMLAAVLLIATVISYVYYFNLLIQMFFRPSVEGKIKSIPFGVTLVIIVCLIGTLLLGLWPDSALDFFNYYFN